MTLTRGAATGWLKGFAQNKVCQRYNVGGDRPLAYHNLVHTFEVDGAAHRIGMKAAGNGKITHRLTTLLEIAACFHDIEQDLGSGANEIESARIAVKEMEQTGAFEDREIEAVRRMILATTVRFEDGMLFQSAVAESSDPEVDYLCQILADADLASLGSRWDRFFTRMKALEQEMYGEDQSLEQKNEFLQRQITLLSRHVFYTPEATELFPFQEENAERLRNHRLSLYG